MLRQICLTLLLLIILPNAFAQDDYILGPGDKIEIRVVGQDELDLTTILSDTGLVSYPFLGEIKMTGLTTRQVEQALLKGLKGDYFVDPSIYVHILEYRPFFIHGEVTNPGAYPYQPGMTVNQAIALAGGLTERASREKIFLFPDGKRQEKTLVTIQNSISAGDTITIEQRFF